jgi:hypothetical protein
VAPGAHHGWRLITAAQGDRQTSWGIPHGFIVTPDMLGESTPQGVECEVGAYLGGNCLDWLMQHMDDTGGAYYAGESGKTGAGWHASAETPTGREVSGAANAAPDAHSALASHGDTRSSEQPRKITPAADAGRSVACLAVWSAGRQHR